MLRLTTMLKRVAIVAPVLLLTVIIWRVTTVRTEMAGALTEGGVMAFACVFWFPLMKETRPSSGGRKRRY